MSSFQRIPAGKWINLFDTLKLHKWSPVEKE